MQLENMQITGLLSRLQSAFELQNRPVFLSTSDRWHLSDRLNAQGKGNSQAANTIQLPQMFLRLVSMGTNQNSYNAGALAVQGVYGALKEGSNVKNRYRFQPVTFGFEVILVAQSFEDIFRFARNYLLFGVVRGALNFTLNYDGIAIDVRVQTDDSVQAPEKDASVDVVNLYEMTTNLQMNGWISPNLDDAVPVPVITNIVREIVATNVPPSPSV